MAVTHHRKNLVREKRGETPPPPTKSKEDGEGGLKRGLLEGSQKEDEELKNRIGDEKLRDAYKDA